MVKKVLKTLGIGFGISVLLTLAFDHGPCGGVFLVFGGGLTIFVAGGMLLIGLIRKFASHVREIDELNHPSS